MAIVVGFHRDVIICRFGFRSFRFQVTTLGRVLTHVMYVCEQAV